MSKFRTAILSRRYKITIPKDVRDAQQWRPGQEFAFVPQGRQIMLVPVPSRDALVGMAKGADPTDARDRSDRV